MLNVTHNFFVDDLKLYAGTQTNLNNLFNIVAAFSNGIDMQFGTDKCANVKIVNVKQVFCRTKINVNGTDISPPVADRDTYRNLGQDENVEFFGDINKEKVKLKNYTNTVVKSGHQNYQLIVKPLHIMFLSRVSCTNLRNYQLDH